MSAVLAVENVRKRIEENPYPGRGIVLGRSEDGAWIQVYWIMGRSDNSRKRERKELGHFYGSFL